MFRKILLASFIAGSFASVPLASFAQQRTIIIREAPPPPREEVVPGQRRGHQWAPGHWAWRNGQHVWVNGRWLRERRGQRWMADTWVERDGRWAYQAGRWERGGRNRDRDGDGVPNRLDARPDNPRRY
jgi:YXWGXW repeat-containing protein